MLPLLLGFWEKMEIAFHFLHFEMSNSALKFTEGWRKTFETHVAENRTKVLPPPNPPPQNHPVLSVGAGTVSKVIWRVTIRVGRRMK